MNKRFRRALFMLLTSLCLVTFISTVNATPAQAKTVTASKNYKKAGKLATGKNKVKFSRSTMEPMFLKFTAAKKGKYKFTLSDFKTDNIVKKKNDDYSRVSINEKKGKNLLPLTFKTEGGSSETMYICTKATWAAHPTFTDPMSSKPKRTMTLSLKKGQSVWIKFMPGQNETCKGTMTVKVQKK